MSLSIVIPVRQEAERLPTLLQALQPLRKAGAEVIVVDGQSTDDTPAIARLYETVLLQIPAGRARQMNAGAAIARGNLLLFLHADTRLPEQESVLALPELLDKKKKNWGFFAVRLDSSHPVLWLVGKMISWRSRLSRVATGDQAIFVNKSLFQQMGGFPDLPIMEDVAFSKRLRRQHPPLVMPQTVTTSARRWEKYGIWQTILLMWRLRWAFWRGVPASSLAKFYHY